MEQTKYKDRSIETFWNKHKKIAIASGVLGALGLVILSFLGVKYFCNVSSFERWFKKASLDELKTVRNNVHAEYLNHTVNDAHRESLWNLMSRLDKKISILEWTGKTPSMSTYHREHGFNLYKPE